MCWLDILLLTTYNATATFITKGGSLEAVLVLTELAELCLAREYSRIKHCS